MRRRGGGLSLGSTVAGRYRLDAKLGEGGMAEVFEARDLETDRTVAVKVLHAHIATNREAVERTKREGKVLSELHNPAIVNVETWGELDDGTVFLVMELLEGETLGERMKRGPIGAAELAPLVAGICAGLHAAHARAIVHRDLKPENIFLQPTDHGTQVKLLDFGISKVYGGEKLTQTGEVLGTPRYMSPEQLGAEPDVDARVDVYALGIILYEALADRPPFDATTPTELIVAILNGKVVPLRSARPDVPEPVASCVMRAMSKVRAARFDTAMAFAEAYIDAVGGPSAVRRQQRRGMATQAFGGMLQKPPISVPKTNPPPAATPNDEVAGKLRIGTFSGLSPLTDEGGQPRAGVSTSLMGMSPGSLVPDDPGGPAPARFDEPLAAKRAPGPSTEPASNTPEEALDGPVSKSGRKIPVTFSPEDPAAQARFPQTQATPAGMGDAPLTSSPAPSPAAPSSASVAPVSPAPSAGGVRSTAVMDADSLPAVPERRRAEPEPLVLPVKHGGARALLVLGALLAGAASAAAMIFALQWYEEREAEATPEPEPTVEAPVEPEPSAPPEPEVEPPVGVEPPAEATPAEDVDEAEAPAPPPSRRSRRRTAPAQPAEAPTPAEPNADSPSSMLRSARAAMRAGRPEECIAILDRAIRTGAPAISLRRRADCYEGAGRRDDAIRDYQRFCRLVPDHPSVGEVRSILAGWGRTCP